MYIYIYIYIYIYTCLYFQIFYIYVNILHIGVISDVFIFVITGNDSYFIREYSDWTMNIGFQMCITNTLR